MLHAFVLVALATVSATTTTKDAVGTLHAEARRIVDEWRDAQNRGDEKAYVALYEQKLFRGVKRASKGTTRFDWAGWSTDRLRMMKTKPTVAVEKVAVTTWLEKKSLKRGVIEVRFVQRWKNARYADHGIKILLLVRNQSGGLRILYEDLLDSHPGWESGTSRWSEAARAQAGKSKASLADAWQKLQQQAPTLAKLETVLNEVEDAELTAQAILANANAACKKIDTSSECGDERIEWAALEPNTPWSDPCVQRRAVLWALSGWNPTTKREIAPVREGLLRFMQLPAPEEELIENVISLASAADKELHYELLAALVETKRIDLAEKNTTGLPPKWMARAANELHLDAAALLLDDKTQRAAILEALADDGMVPETRSVLLGKARAWKGTDVDTALIAVAENATHCELAMAAALELEKRGKKNYVPTRVDDIAKLGWALCRNQHDDNSERKQRLWRSVLPVAGKVKIIDHLEDDFAERDESGQKIEREDTVSTLKRGSSTADDLDSVFGSGDAPECTRDACEVKTSDGYYRLTFTNGKDGKPYVSEIYRYHWSGCGC